MKTTKLMLAIVFFAFTTMGFAQTKQVDQNEPVPTLSTKISLRTAMQDPGLLRTMHEVLSSNMLVLGDQKIYTAKVTYRKVVYVIWASKNQWERFFCNVGIDPNGGGK